MTHRTNTEIEDEIKALELIKPNVRRFSAFGDDNHESIDAQIAVLKERMDSNQLYNRYEDPYDPEMNRNELDAAIEAYDWMTGASDEESPSQGWTGLSK